MSSGARPLHRSHLVRLFEFEPDLLDGVPPDEVALARARVVVDAEALSEATQAPAPGDPPKLGFLILEGALVGRYEVFGRTSVELVGPGDVLGPTELSASPGEGRVTWCVRADARLGRLDERLERDLARWPHVVPELVDRFAQRSRRLMTQLAIAQIPSLECRLLSLLWFLAERWGTVGSNGVTVRIPVNQAVLSELACARRPSVNSALRRLREQGVVERSTAGELLLRAGERGPAQRLAAGAP